MLPVSSPMRTTARFPLVKGTAPGVGVDESVFVGVVVVVLVRVYEGVRVPVGVNDGVPVVDTELDEVKTDEVVPDIVCVMAGVIDGCAPLDRDADAEAVALGVCDEVSDADAVPLELRDADDVLVGDAVAAAGANATL